jgi:hypothetical protein
MARNITLKLGSDAGIDLGPFNMTVSTGTITPTTVTRAELLAGKVFSISSDDAVTVTTTSTGDCTNSTTTNIAAVVVSNCTIYNFSVSQLDLDDAAGNANPEWNGTVFFRYIDCANVERVEAINDESVAPYCVSSDTTPISVTYYNNENELQALFSFAEDTEVSCTG